MSRQEDATRPDATGPHAAGSEPAATGRRPRLSLIVPVYGNEDNVPSLVAAIEELNARLGGRLEAVFVVDGSPDMSAARLLAARATFGFAYKIALHSRNFGSFTAIRTGLELATGEHYAAMAADLQEPPELIERFFELLEKDEADVVFGQRTGRSDSAWRDALSATFWWLYRRLVIADIPPGGVDIFACNRAVRDVLLTIREPNSSLIAQLFWVGFRRSFVPYARRKREIGKSSWGVARRLRYMMDSIFSFSDLPILVLLWFGVLGCLLSLLFGLVVIVARLAGFIQEPGYATIVLLLTFFGSASLAVQGVLGSYLWRTFENTKQRPLRIVSSVVEGDAAGLRETGVSDGPD